MMRKIKSEEDIERVRRRNNIILGTAMIFLLVASTAGFSLMSGDSEDKSSVSELGFDFVRNNGLWKTVIGSSTDGHDSGEPEVFGFRYLPSEVADVDVNLSRNIEDYSGEVLYFVNSGEGVSEVLNNLGKYVLRYQEACLNNSSDSCGENLPIKSCDDNLIIFEDGNETRVYGNESCVYIVGDSALAADAFLYEVLDIR